MLAFVIFAVTFLVALLGLIIWLYPGARKVSTIPGLDPSHPKDGNLADITKAGSLYEFLAMLHEDYGSIASFWMGQQFTVSIASPELFKEQCKVHDRPPEMYKIFEPLFTSASIQYANGAEGRKRRTAYDPVYSHENVNQEYLPIFRKIAEDLAKKWATIPREEHLPLREYMFALAIKSIAEASFGKFFEDEKVLLKLKSCFDTCFNELESRLTENIPDADSPRQKRFDRDMDVIVKLLTEALKERREFKVEGSLLIDVLVHSGYPETTILADAITYFVGGFHTTGFLMTWVLYFLASHEDIQERCYKELVDVLEDEPLTAEVINNLGYMRQVLDETMRCSVLAPYATRFQNIDIELGGHKVPAGTPVLQALGVVLQDEDLWPEPTRFDPDRFSPENRKKLKPFAFEPFGFAGKRKCPGYRFSYTEATTFLSVLLRKFKIKLVPGQIPVPEYGIITKPKEEIYITIEKR